MIFLSIYRKYNVFTGTAFWKNVLKDIAEMTEITEMHPSFYFAVLNVEY